MASHTVPIHLIDNHMVLSGSSPRELFGKPTDLYDCAACLEEDLDPYETPVHLGPGHTLICRECVTACECCGEWMDALQAINLGPAIVYRQFECNGRLSKPTHAQCAANDILGFLANDRTFDADDFTREEIALIVRADRRSVAA
jgi:hypothetical protein